MIELLVVIAIIAILASMLLPALARAKETARRIKCVNDTRQFGLAATMYVDDNDGQFPARSNGNPPRWPEALRDYYKDLRLLVCPSDGANPATAGTGTNADAAPRSYIMNGWNDIFEEILGSPLNLQSAFGKTVRETDVTRPSDTILFGEKETTSAHFYMDFLEGAGNDFTEVEQSRHAGRGGSGGSNFTFVDGSVQYLRYGKMLEPENLWATTDKYRFSQ